MVREIKDRNLFNRLKSFSSTPFFVPVLFLLFLVLTIPVITLITSRPVEIRQRAAGTPTATVQFSPANGNFTVGQPFTVSLLIDGGGQTFNAAQADIAISSNLGVQNLTITPPEQGGCEFIFVNQQKTPTTTDPSFAAAILGSSKSSCTLFTMTLVPNSTGTGTLTMSRVAVISHPGHEQILASYQNGSYQLGPVVTPTDIPTPTPTPTVVPTATPTSVPTPSSSPTPTPTDTVVPPPSINPINAKTYEPSLTLGGSKATDVVLVFVNNSSSGVTYPTATTWERNTTLTLGVNNFNVYGQNSSGFSSSTVSVSISLNRTGDINGDNTIDLSDLSTFGTDWEKTSDFNDILSDMNSDGVVDIFDFSIIASAYGT